MTANDSHHLTCRFKSMFKKNIETSIPSCFYRAAMLIPMPPKEMLYESHIAPINATNLSYELSEAGAGV